jgi:hypothetical protein
LGWQSERGHVQQHASTALADMTNILFGWCLSLVTACCDGDSFEHKQGRQLNQPASLTVAAAAPTGRWNMLNSLPLLRQVSTAACVKPETD